MNETELFKAIGSVDEKYIPELTLPAAKRPHLRHLWVAAACVALLMAFSVVAVATSEDGVPFVKIFSGTKQGIRYEQEMPIGAVSRSEITGQITEVKEIILEQIANYSPTSNFLPTSWIKYYDTSAEALAYLGCERVRFPDMGWQETQTHLSVNGDSKGDFQYISVNIDYQHTGHRMQCSARIYTDPDTETVTIGFSDPYRDAFTQENYTTASGKQAVIIATSKEGSFSSITGYITADNILYSLHVIGDDQQSATELLRQWLDAF